MKVRAAQVSTVVDNIRRVFQVLTEQSKKIESETELTGPQLWTIKILNENSPMKVSELAGKMYLHPATMVGLLDRLEMKGLVTRTRSDQDRRVVFIDLTDLARRIVMNSPEVVQVMLVKGLENLSDQKLKKASEGLQMIVDILGAKELPPKLIMSTEINFPKRTRKKTAALSE